MNSIPVFALRPRSSTDAMLVFQVTERYKDRLTPLAKRILEQPDTVYDLSPGVHKRGWLSFRTDTGGACISLRAAQTGKADDIRVFSHFRTEVINAATETPR
jgi:hypothetical protein